MRGGDHPSSSRRDARVKIALSVRRKIRPLQTCRRHLANPL